VRVFLAWSFPCLLRIDASTTKWKAARILASWHRLLSRGTSRRSQSGDWPW